MEVYLEDNHIIGIDFGDIFYDSNEEQYFIFTVLGKNLYGLVSSSFNEIYNDEVHNDFERATNSIKLYVKDGYLQHYSSDDYNISMSIKRK